MSCTTGNRRPQPLTTDVSTALAKGQRFNPTIHHEGQYHYIMVTTKDNTISKQYLGRSLQRYRFALACDCDGGHCFYETLHNFTQREERLCRFCTPATGLWEAAGKDAIPECEARLMCAMKELDIDRQVACQADLQWWHGRVDFYHMPTRTAIQVDGSSHFTTTNHRLPCHQLQMDLKCCRAAWMGASRLLRIHHNAAAQHLVVLEAMRLPHHRFVMITRQYESVTVTWGGMTRTYSNWLECVLPGSKCYVHTGSNCLVYC